MVCCYYYCTYKFNCESHNNHKPLRRGAGATKGNDGKILTKTNNNNSKTITITPPPVTNVGPAPLFVQPSVWQGCSGKLGWYSALSASN